MSKPKIRFKGYEEDWEQRKLGDIFKEYSEKKHSELPALTIIQGKGTIKREESDRNLMYDKSKLDGYKMVRKNDFIVHLRSFEGGLEKASSDGIISPAYHTFHGENIDSRFYYPYFRSYEFIKRKLIAHVYGIRDGRSIDISGMKTIKIPYTSYMEQVKIGDYLDQLDNLITLHQRKCEETKKLKKYMLQKMFPQNGKRVPEIRFVGFTDDWEQRKLGDVLEEFSNKSTVEDEYTVLSSTNTGMEFRDGRVSGTSNLGYKIIEIDDLVLSPQNLWLGNININNLEKGLVSPSYKTFKLRNIDKEFFRPQLRTKKMLELYKQASVQGASVVRRNLDMDLFEQIELNIPMIEEQAKIGEYFFNLDYLITLHQRKYEELQKIKKFMLQNMFI